MKPYILAIPLLMLATVIAVGCVSTPPSTDMSGRAATCYGSEAAYKVDSQYFRGPENCEVLLAVGVSTSIACEDLNPRLVCVDFRKCVDRNREALHEL